MFSFTAFSSTLRGAFRVNINFNTTVFEKVVVVVAAEYSQNIQTRSTEFLNLVNKNGNEKLQLHTLLQVMTEYK